MTRFGIDPPAFLTLARGGRDPHPSHQLVAPSSLRSRALELLLAEVRSGSLEARAALAIHERLTELKVRLLGDRMSRRTAWDFALRHDWPDLVDAEYLAVTRLQADALIAADPGLMAKAEGIVTIASLDDLFVAAPG